MNWSEHATLETTQRCLAAAETRSAKTRLAVNQNFAALEDAT